MAHGPARAQNAACILTFVERLPSAAAECFLTAWEQCYDRFCAIMESLIGCSLTQALDVAMSNRSTQALITNLPCSTRSLDRYFELFVMMELPIVWVKCNDYWTGAWLISLDSAASSARRRLCTSASIKLLSASLQVRAPLFMLNRHVIEVAHPGSDMMLQSPTGGGKSAGVLLAPVASICLAHHCQLPCLQVSVRPFTAPTPRLIMHSQVLYLGVPLEAIRTDTFLTKIERVVSNLHGYDPNTAVHVVETAQGGCAMVS